MTDVPQLAIECVGLSKIYGSNDDAVQALRDVDLAIEKGQIYALLGPNGAGKTTAISILTTLVVPTSGSATVAGYDVSAEAQEVRRRIGVTFQEMVLDEELTGRQTLDFHGRLYGQPKGLRRLRIDELVGMVDLNDALDRRVSTYSGGMKRRLELARGLMTNPDVLFLDEPTQGLDPQNRVGVWDYIRRMREASGLTLLLTTHYMDEAAELADRVGIIDHGKLVVEGEPDKLVQEMGADVVTLRGAGDYGTLPDALRQLAFVSNLVAHVEPIDSSQGGGEDQGWRLQIGVENGDQRLPQLISMAVDSGATISNVRVSRPSLADVFLAYTGHALRDT